MVELTVASRIFKLKKPRKTGKGEGLKIFNDLLTLWQEIAEIWNLCKKN